MTELLIVQGLLGVVAAVIVLFVAFPYRGRSVPRAERLTEKVVAVAERVDPGEAPPLGVLSDPEKSRTMSARFERVEDQIRRGVRTVVPARRSAESIDLTERPGDRAAR